ncbi:hypothetical protein CHELA41_51160 [Hyphomicrobiales bacterium]|nr:hypothetical protein CHELA41_51160 [Hyphomicrobiales bacterium]
MVGHHNLDRLAEHLAAEVLDRHADRGYGTRAGLVGKLTGHIRQNADTYDIIGNPGRLRPCGGDRQSRNRSRKRQRGQVFFCHASNLPRIFKPATRRVRQRRSGHFSLSGKVIPIDFHN